MVGGVKKENSRNDAHEVGGGVGGGATTHTATTNAHPQVLAVALPIQ